MSLNKRRGWIRPLACIVVVHGCYGPNPDYLGLTADDDASGHGEGNGATGDGGDSDDMDAGNSSDDGSMSCADGIPQAGEFCFSTATLLEVPVQSMGAGDFDLDGHIDLGVAAEGDLRVLFGDGSGGFPLQLDLPKTEGYYLDAAVGDLDQDGHPDLLFSNFAKNSVVFHASHGNTSFAAPISFPVGAQPIGVRLAMLNGDEKLDVLVANKGSDEVSVLFNQGLGMLGTPTNHSTGSDEPRRLVAHHFDPGPSLDLAVVNHDGKELSILLGSGEGSFASAHVQPLGGKPRDLAAADFDLDGVRDLAVVLEDVDKVEILFGDGLGGFGPKKIMIGVGNKPIGIAAVDLDVDGALDLVVLNQDDSNVGVLFGSEVPGQFLAQQILVGLSEIENLTTIVVSDLNDDGVADLAVGGDELRTLISNP